MIQIIINIFNNKYLFFDNYNISIINYNLLHYKILKNYTNTFFLPIILNNNLIKNYIKIYDIAYIDNNNDDNIINLFKLKNIIVNNINNFKKNDYLNILFKHKIFINFNNYDLYNELLLKYCIYNNIIIINCKKNLINNIPNLSEINSFIIEISENLLINIVLYILNNYDTIINNIYENLTYDYDNIKKEYNNFFDNICDKHINKVSKASKESNSNYGFIILRHINSELTNKYWIESYKCIRKYYNNKIIIIDDNSDNNYVTNDIDLINCDILKSEYPYCGELLGYYYFHKYHFFEKAIIIHDSVFINKFIDFSKFKNYKIKYLWHFTHDWDNIEEEINILNYFNNNELNNFYHKKDEWYGCYGLQCYIDYNFLDNIVKKYNLFILLKYINNRELRMNLERVLSVIFTYEYEPLRKDPSIYGIIHHYIHWGYLFENYINDKKNKKLEKYDLLKVWSGR